MMHLQIDYVMEFSCMSDVVYTLKDVILMIVNYVLVLVSSNLENEGLKIYKRSSIVSSNVW